MPTTTGVPVRQSSPVRRRTPPPTTTALASGEPRRRESEPPEPLSVYWVCPGQSSRPDRLDAPLSANGRWHIQGAAEKLRGIQIHSIVTSEDHGAWESGKIIAETLFLRPPDANELLNERRSTTPQGFQAQVEEICSWLRAPFRTTIVVAGERLGQAVLARFGDRTGRKLGPASVVRLVPAPVVWL